MKNFLLVYAVACMGLALNTQKLFSQNISDVKYLSASSAERLRPDHNSALPVNTTKDFRNAIHIKAVRGFIKNFRKAENVLWRMSGHGNFIAEFTNDFVQTTVAYGARGMWNFTVKRYAGDKLPEFVRSMIKSTYNHYTVKDAAESTCWQNSENVVYTVVISNGSNIKILTIYNAEMKVTTDFTIQKVSQY